MGSTREKIANMALGHCGVSGFIANLATDTSAEATTCNTFFETAIEEALEDFPWGEASAYVALGLVAENPNNEWAYAYRYPTDCVFVRHIVTSAGRVNLDPPPYEIGQDDQGKLIYTDEPQATIKYTKRLTDPARFSATFTMAASWRLAMLVSPIVARVKGLAERTEAGYARSIAKARVKAANEHQADAEQDADHIRSRD